MKWPFVRRKTMDDALSAERRRLLALKNKEKEELETDWRDKWHPLLHKAMELSASRRDHSGDFMLHVGVARDMLEMAAMHNEPRVWEYLSEQLSYEFRRQISTLNFAGLHRLASETERRYGRSYDAPTPYPRAMR